MIPFFSQPVMPTDHDRIESGRPPSRIDVQQYLLHHKRQQYLQSGMRVRRSTATPFSIGIRRGRHSLGNLLIGLGSWMTRESAAGPSILARR